MKKHQDNGGIIIEGEGECLVGAVTITETELYIRDGHCKIMYFEASPEYDHGLYMSIEQWRDRFKDWKFIPKGSYLTIDQLG